MQTCICYAYSNVYVTKKTITSLIVNILCSPPPGLRSFSAENFHSSYSCPGKRPNRFGFFTFFFYF